MVDATTTTELAPGVRVESYRLPSSGDRSFPPIDIIRFGEKGTGPKAYFQTGLHADELPGMLVLTKLKAELLRYAAEGKLKGEIVLVPVCNPIGLSQTEGGYLMGRVERGTDRNFNRGYPDLARLIQEKVSSKLGDDEAENIAIIRKAMRKATAKLSADGAFEAMQRLLIREACDADVVLDIHADNEAQLHLYIDAANWPDGQDLAAELDARAILLGDESGGEPFDETCGHAWAKLKEIFPERPIPQACFSSTVELRSNNAVSHENAERDARALARFLMRRGFINEEPGSLPRLLCEAYPIRAMQQVRSPSEGVVVYRARLGDRVREGEVLAEIISPRTGETENVLATTDGIFFARHDQRWAWPQKVIGKVAGKDVLPERTGKLLTD